MNECNISPEQDFSTGVLGVSRVKDEYELAFPVKNDTFELEAAPVVLLLYSS